MENLDYKLTIELLKYANKVKVEDLPGELKSKVSKWYLKFAGAETEPIEEQDYLVEGVFQYTVGELVELINEN